MAFFLRIFDQLLSIIFGELVENLCLDKKKKKTTGTKQGREREGEENVDATEETIRFVIIIRFP